MGSWIGAAGSWAGLGLSFDSYHRLVPCQATYKAMSRDTVWEEITQGSLRKK